MTRKCFVATCTNTYRKTRNVCVIDEKTCTLTSITYHSFPRDPILRAKWIRATGRINWAPVSGHAYICSEHFKESDYAAFTELLKNNTLAEENIDNSNTAQVKRVLRKRAVPSQQLGSVIVSGDSEVYLKEDRFASSGELSEESESSDDRIELLPNPNHINSLAIDHVNIEPCLQNDTHPSAVSLTSTVTIKEEIDDDSEKYNGMFEHDPSIDNSTFDSLHFKSDLEHTSAKRVKHENNFIPPMDIKIERPTTPIYNNMTVEEKYERLLDQYLTLKREYDVMKIKYDRQTEALNECEKILRQCRFEVL